MEVRESGLPGLPEGSSRGLFATKKFEKGEVVVHVLGKFGYGKEYARKTKSTRVWNLGLVGEEEGAEVQQCYLNSMPHSPASFANDGKHGVASGGELGGENVRFEEDDSFPRSDYNRMRFVALNDINKGEEIYISYGKNFLREKYARKVFVYDDDDVETVVVADDVELSSSSSSDEGRDEVHQQQKQQQGKQK